MTEDRRNAIIRLLDTRNEHLPEPVRRSEASTGFAHTEPTRVSCPDCLANGKAMFGCETCGGRGYTEEKRDRDPYSLSDKVVPFGFDGSRHDATRARDRQIDSLGQQLRPPPSEAKLLEEANRSAYAWERAREQMYRKYDYASLDRALEALQHAFPGRSPRSDGGLRFLDEWLPHPLRAPGDQPVVVNITARGRHADTRALSQRDAAIIRAITGGAPTEHVALSFSLSVSQVNKIVRGAAA